MKKTTLSALVMLCAVAFAPLSANAQISHGGAPSFNHSTDKAAAPTVVRQKLIVYYIADKEGWTVSDEEYESELSRQLAYYADAQGITTDEALKKYGEDFFRQAIQYNKVLTNLVGVTNVE